MADKAKRGVKRVFKFKKILTYFIGVIFLLFIGFQIYQFLTTFSCANSISCIKDLSGQYKHGENEREFQGKLVAVPKESSGSSIYSSVLGTHDTDKKIFIDLSAQRLYAKEKDATVYEFVISSGKPWWPTPTGVFNIWIKLRYTRMEGGSKSLRTYYNLSNVPYVMYFYNEGVPKFRGYGIHGAYWHNNFGNPMSHGCINMRPEDAEILYAWAQPQSSKYTTFATADNPGTQVIISGETPRAQ